MTVFNFNIDASDALCRSLVRSLCGEFEGMADEVYQLILRNRSVLSFELWDDKTSDRLRSQFDGDVQNQV